MSVDFRRRLLLFGGVLDGYGNPSARRPRRPRTPSLENPTIGHCDQDTLRVFRIPVHYGSDPGLGDAEGPE